MLQQDLAKATADLKKSVGLDGESILARIQLGMAYHRSKSPAEARSAFQAAEAAFPQSPDALNYHAEFLGAPAPAPAPTLANGRPRAALCRAAVPCRGGGVRPAFALTGLLRRAVGGGAVENGDLAGALAKFEKAVAVSGGSFALAHVNLGVLKLHSEQDLHGAMERCKKAVEVDPLCETAHVHMAHLYLQSQQLEEAVAAFDDATALLRVKTELEEAFTMREAAAAQLALISSNPKLYKPAIEQQRQQAAAMAMQMAQQQGR